MAFDAWEILIPTIEKNLNKIEELNKQQLQKGLASDGGTSGRHSGSKISRKYVNEKVNKGIYDSSIYPAVNLYNTGDFYRKLTAKMDLSFGIYIESFDAKADVLEERYGSKIYGLTKESMNELVKLIIDDYRAEIFKYLTNANP